MKSSKSVQVDFNIDDPDFEKLIPRLRPSEDIHPKSSNKFQSSKRLEDIKAAVTEDSSYQEFAWEFLRRNRFYQALIDRRKNLIPETKWGYRWHPSVSRAHGLVRLKPYWEAYQENEHPSWMGLDSFVEQLPTSTNMLNTTVEIPLRPGQVVVVFDVGNSIAGQSPWSEQVDAIGQRLKFLCQKDFNGEAINGKPHHRSALLRRLKMFDLLSMGKPLSSAAAVLNLTYKRKVSRRSPNSQENVFLALMPEKPTTTAFDDATEAYNLVYRHGYMSLLRGDRFHHILGNHFVPHTILENNDEIPEDW